MGGETYTFKLYHWCTNIARSPILALATVSFRGITKGKEDPAVHGPVDHPTTKFGFEGNRTQACVPLRWQPFKFDIAFDYCTTRGIAWHNLNFI